MAGLSALLALLAACSSAASQDPTATAGKSGSPGSGSVSTLTVSESGINLAAAPAFLAQKLGYFNDQNLNVQFTIDGANYLDDVVAGRADLGIGSVGGALIPVSQGQDTTVILAAASMLISAYVVGTQGVTNVSQCKTIATGSVGSGYYGASYQYESLLNEKWEIVPYSDQTSMVAAVVGGHDNCGVMTEQLAQSAVQEHKLNVLVDPRAQTAIKGFPQNLGNTAIFGMTSHLPSIRNQVVAFLKGWMEGLDYIKSHTSAQVVQVLQSDNDKNWGAFKAAQLASSLDYLRPMIGVTPISASTWASNLEFQHLSGLTYVNETDSKWSYAQRVDASYYEAAVGTNTNGDFPLVTATS
jgi:ABC-type nitrate/sulfonate/bicarbonate transport system substrate-binding protein